MDVRDSSDFGPSKPYDGHEQTAADGRFGAIDLKQRASIPRRTVRVVGHPHSGWRGAMPGDHEAIEVEFSFSVTDDGSGSFLLVYESLDKRFSADSCHETIEEAFACGEESFGIRLKEWARKAA